MNENTILDALERFSLVKGLKPSTVCLRAVNHGGVYRKLKNGGSCSLATANRILEYIAKNSSIDVDALIQAGGPD